MRVAGWGAAAARRSPRWPKSSPCRTRAFDGAALLISVPHGQTLAAITAALVKAGASVRSSALVGSHATRYTRGRQRPARGLPHG